MEASSRARDPELKKDLDATVDARRELGADYETALVESFLEKVEQRLDSTVDRRVRRQLAEQQMAVARDASRPARASSGDGGFGERFGFAIISLILAIPLSAIGVANAGLPGLLVAWAGILAVNTVHAAGGWPWQPPGRGRERVSDWEG
ncbi:hypothetical protein [Streptomyces candidus]|uniref:Putative membrane protein n=1 Tax=Streptomyces candidus TaxID=67283 RepID=A0A7X0HD38_9ACTN|nr:hypothetical protein [Streptomyces candidus]MBB6435380.1 putative membrane protein [Streptomyces candidus]GHH47712.1 hypothetical protein GCM10018773_40740 [Streptomyces candidus]